MQAMHMLIACGWALLYLHARLMMPTPHTETYGGPGRGGLGVPWVSKVVWYLPFFTSGCQDTLS